MQLYIVTAGVLLMSLLMGHGDAVDCHQCINVLSDDGTLLNKVTGDDLNCFAATTTATACVSGDMCYQVFAKVTATYDTTSTADATITLRGCGTATGTPPATCTAAEDDVNAKAYIEAFTGFDVDSVNILTTPESAVCECNTNGCNSVQSPAANCYECLTVQSYNKAFRDAILGDANHTPDCEANLAGVSTTCSLTEKCITAEVTGTWTHGDSGSEIIGDGTIIARTCIDDTYSQTDICPGLQAHAGAKDIVTSLVTETLNVANGATEKSCVCGIDLCNNEDMTLNRLTCQKCSFVEGATISGSADACRTEGANLTEECSLNEQCTQVVVTDGTVTPPGGTPTPSMMVVRDCYEGTDSENSACSMVSNDTAAEILASDALEDSADAISVTTGETCICEASSCNNVKWNKCHECLAVQTSHAGLEDAIGKLNTYDSNCDSASGIAAAKTCYGYNCVEVEVEGPMSGAGATNEVVVAVGRTCSASTVNTNCANGYNNAEAIINELLGSGGITMGTPQSGKVKGCDCSDGDYCANTKFTFQSGNGNNSIRPMIAIPLVFGLTILHILY